MLLRPKTIRAVWVQHLLDAVTADQDYAEAWLCLGLLQVSHSVAPICVRARACMCGVAVAVGVCARARARVFARAGTCVLT